MSVRLSPSRLQLAAICAASAGLARIDTTGAAADRGHGIHAFAVDAWKHGRAAALMRLPKDTPWRATVEWFDPKKAAEKVLRKAGLDWVPCPQCQGTPGFMGRGGICAVCYGRCLAPASMGFVGLETIIAYDVISGEVRCLGDDLESARQKRSATEMLCILDALIVVGEVALVLDWKTGRAEQPDASDHWQLAAYRVAATKWLQQNHPEVKRVLGAIVVIHEDGSTSDDIADEWDEFDLVERDMEIRKIAARVARVQAQDAQGIRPDVLEGDHCRKMYCASFDYCPAKTGLVRQAASAIEGVSEKDFGAITPERAGQIWIGLKRWREILDRLQNRIEKFAVLRPFQLPDGRWVKERLVSPRPKEYVTDPEIAERVLEEMDPEVARIAVKKSISKGAIYDACKQIYGANGVSRGSAICARIRREGGIEKVSGDPALEVGEGAE